MAVFWIKYIMCRKLTDSRPIDFDEDLWLALVERVTINADESIVFKFKGGIEITEQM